MVEFHKRYDQSNLIIKDKIQNNEIGNLEYAIIEYSQRKSIPTKYFSNWINKTNIFQYLGVHYVDLIHYITNFKPITVHAFGQKDYLNKKNIKTFDSIQVIIEWLRHDNRKFVSIHICNWIDPNNTSAMSDQTIKIIGEKGRISSDQKNRGMQIVTDKNGINDINPYFTSTLDNHNLLSNQSFGYGIESINNFLKLCGYFIKNPDKNIDRYLKKNEHLPTFKTSFISTIIIEAVNNSLQKRRAIKIKV